MIQLLAACESRTERCELVTVEYFFFRFIDLINIFVYRIYRFIDVYRFKQKLHKIRAKGNEGN